MQINELPHNYIYGARFRTLASNKIVYTDADFFIPVMDHLRKLRDEYIVISHNGDYAIDDERANYIPRNVPKVFAQNNLSSNTKITSLPIRLANPEWKHGNIQNIINAIKQTDIINIKTIAYLSAKKETNINERYKIESYYRNEDWCEVNNGNMEPTEYYSRVRQSYFNISPPGNGPDCHRIWETIYLGRVPVVQKNPAMAGFTDLPILFVDDLTSVTEDFLHKEWHNFKDWSKFNLYKMKFDYWEKTIQYEAGKII